MSNRVNLVGTTFTNTGGGQTFGFRMYDDGEAQYCNTLAAVIEDDMELLKEVIENHPYSFRHMLEFAKEEGLYVNDVWYSADEIYHLFEGVSHWYADYKDRAKKSKGG